MVLTSSTLFLIRVTPRLTAATGDVALSYLVFWVPGFFGIAVPVSRGGGTRAIGFGVFVVGLATSKLLLDLESITLEERSGVPPATWRSTTFRPSRLRRYRGIYVRDGVVQSCWVARRDELSQMNYPSRDGLPGLRARASSPPAGHSTTTGRSPKAMTIRSAVAGLSPRPGVTARNLPK